MRANQYRARNETRAKSDGLCPPGARSPAGDTEFSHGAAQAQWQLRGGELRSSALAARAKGPWRGARLAGSAGAAAQAHADQGLRGRTQ